MSARKPDPDLFPSLFDADLSALEWHLREGRTRPNMGEAREFFEALWEAGRKLQIPLDTPTEPCNIPARKGNR